MKPFIAIFTNEVLNDYHGSYRKKLNAPIRFNSLAAANKAAEIYTRNQPKKPYVKHATVFNGPLIVCPVHTCYISSEPGYNLNPYLNYVFVNCTCTIPHNAAIQSKSKTISTY